MRPTRSSRDAPRRAVRASRAGAATRARTTSRSSRSCSRGRRRQVIYPDVPDNFRTRLDLQWPFYTGGRVDALERAARAERQASRRGPGRGPRRPAARDHARLLGARDGARSRAGAGPVAREHRRATCGTCARGSTRGSSRRTRCCRPKRSSRASACCRSRPPTRAAIAEADLRRLLGAEGPAPIEPAARLDPVVGRTRRRRRS